jgi:hypothetical protein
MDRRYDSRLTEMLAQAEGAVESLDGFLSRLEIFGEPFSASLVGSGRYYYIAEYLTTDLPDLEHKTGEAITYLLEQGYQGHQKFIGKVPWADRSLPTTLARNVRTDLNQRGGPMILDSSRLTKFKFRGFAIGGTDNREDRQSLVIYAQRSAQGVISFLEIPSCKGSRSSCASRLQRLRCAAEKVDKLGNPGFHATSILEQWLRFFIVTDPPQGRQHVCE